MRRRSFNFDPFGERLSASARLRAWAIADELQLQGHAATVRDAAVPEVEVFQKVRNHQRLGYVRRRGAFTVFDLDDNYLLEDVGARRDVLAFMNLVDLVTVGSSEILSAVEPYHDAVRLFENPLDVAPDASPRGAQLPWRGRIGWFGNRTNLAALERAGLQHGVTTVTRGGDVEWALDTVDAVVAGFDLVVLPVELSAWTSAKNANRLLKAIALGVPVLASRTDEHERAAHDLELPDWMLVSPGDSWDAAIDVIRDRYDEAVERAQAGRLRAIERYGIRASVSAWLALVNEAMEDRDAEPGAPRRGRLEEQARGRMRDVDVVVLNENEPEFADVTIASLDRDELSYRSVTLVSANRCEPPDTRLDVTLADAHDDFFAVYHTLADAVADGGGSELLLLRAGSELRKGFFTEVAADGPRPGVALFQQQLAGEAGALIEPVPDTVDPLLTRPQHPHALMVGREELRAVGGLSAGMASFAVWELLLRLYAEADVTVRHCAAPVVLVDPRAHRRHAVQSYSVWIARNRPELVEELPGHQSEWQRLSYTLHAGVVDRHRQLFASRATSLVPALAGEALELEQQIERLDARLRQANRPPAATPPGAEEAVAAELAVVPVENGRPDHRLPEVVRMPARLVRAVVGLALPRRVRIRIYRRHRSSYDALFPERRPEPGGDRAGRPA